MICLCAHTAPPENQKKTKNSHRVLLPSGQTLLFPSALLPSSSLLSSNTAGTLTVQAGLWQLRDPQRSRLHEHKSNGNFFF